MDLLNTVRLYTDVMSISRQASQRRENTYAKLNGRREEVNALVSKERALDKGGGDDALLAGQTTEESVSESRTGICH